MRRNRFLEPVLILGLAAGVSAAGCAKREAPPAAAAAKPAGAAGPISKGGGKIPVTTSSAEAKAEFLKGRDDAEKLQVTDSIAHFQKAVSLDPDFALAELNLAASAPTGAGFFEHLHKAVSLADKASNGEKLMILATEAGANNDPAKQKEYLDALVAAYPDDERAHFNLGGWFFGQQRFPEAIEQYRKATELGPGYSTAYNILGYAYRQNGDFADAEKAFQKYIELIPKDPNPYDSYAELLLKMGRFDDSIAQYRKALEIDANFLNAHQGIAMDLLYSGKAREAEAELANITKKARTDGERRTALFARTVVHLDGGKTAQALADVDAQVRPRREDERRSRDVLRRRAEGEHPPRHGQGRSGESGVRARPEARRRLGPFTADQGERRARRPFQPRPRRGREEGPEDGEERSRRVPQGRRSDAEPGAGAERATSSTGSSPWPKRTTTRRSPSSSRRTSRTRRTSIASLWPTRPRATPRRRRNTPAGRRTSTRCRR